MSSVVCFDKSVLFWGQPIMSGSKEYHLTPSLKSSLEAMSISTGDAAPDFEAKAWDQASASEKTLRLSDFQGSKVVLLFYPGDFTPVCTAEMCDFQDNIGAFKDIGVQVVGISTDSLAKHKKFAEKYNLDFPLIADEDKKIGKLYGVQGPLGGSHRRAVFLIDENGKIQWHKTEATALFRTSAKKILEIVQ